MTDIEFFENTELSDISKIRIYDDLAGQNAYFSGLTKKTVQGQYKGFTQPLLVYEPIEDAVKYAYGRFKLGTYWYYFFVTDVQQDTAGKSWISYRIDYWETTRYQFGTSLGRGTISRSSMVEPCATPYNAKYMKKLRRRKVSRFVDMDTWVSDGFNVPDIVFFYRDHTSNINRIGYVSQGSSGFTYDEKSLIFSGKWPSFLRSDGEITESDIVGAWFTPPIVEIDLYELNSGWRLLNGKDGKFTNKTILGEYPSDGTGTSTIIPLSGNFLPKGVLGHYSTNSTQTAVITDLQGNIVYQFDFNRDYSDYDMGAILSISPTACKWLVSTPESLTLGNGTKSFSYPNIPIDLFIDQYTEYFARQRQFDINTRELNAKKNLTSGIVGGATNALAGAATGAMVGSVVPGIGTAIGAGVGAIAGAFGGLITGGAQYGTDQYFNPQEQAITDDYYKNAVDKLAIIGSDLFNFLFLGSVRDGVIQFEFDDDTKARIESDIAEFGQYTSRSTENGESFIGNDARLKGDFIINGNIPESWKAGIQSRFSTGVHIIKH